MAVDFNPMLGRNLAKEMQNKESLYSIGQVLGENNYFPGKFLGGGALGAFNLGKKGFKKIPGLLSMLKKSMINDKGLFQGGMDIGPNKDKIFGRLRDEANIVKSDLKGKLKYGLDFDPNKPNIGTLGDREKVMDPKGLLSGIYNNNNPAITRLPIQDNRIQDAKDIRLQDSVMNYNENPDDQPFIEGLNQNKNKFNIPPDDVEDDSLMSRLMRMLFDTGYQERLFGSSEDTSMLPASSFNEEGY